MDSGLPVILQQQIDALVAENTLLRLAVASIMPAQEEGQVVSAEVEQVEAEPVTTNEVNYEHVMNDLLIEAKDDLIANQEHGTLGVQNRATSWKAEAARKLPGDMVAEAVGEIDSIVEDICQAIRSARGERSN